MFGPCCWPRSRARRIRSSSTWAARAALVRDPARGRDPARDPGHAPPAGAARRDPALAGEVAVWAVPLRRDGGAPLPRRHRLVGVLGPPRQDPAIQEGGLGIHGALLGVRSACGARATAGIPQHVILASAAPGRCHSAQAVGRIGNWFNQELFGKARRALPWGLEIQKRVQAAGGGYAPGHADVPADVPVRGAVEPESAVRTAADDRTTQVPADAPATSSPSTSRATSVGPVLDRRSADRPGEGLRWAAPQPVDVAPRDRDRARARRALAAGARAAAASTVRRSNEERGSGFAILLGGWICPASARPSTRPITTRGARRDA